MTQFPMAKPKSNCKSTIPKERRFMQYYFNEKCTNTLLGPTTYDFSNFASKNYKIPCFAAYVFFYLIDRSQTIK